LFQIFINLKQFQSVDTIEIKGIVFERNADEINRLTSKTGKTVQPEQSVQLIATTTKTPRGNKRTFIINYHTVLDVLLHAQGANEGNP
jgi:hypothetical protein